MARPNEGFTTDEYATVSEPVPPYPQTFQPPNPPNYNDIIKIPTDVNVMYLPPPRYDGLVMNNQVIVVSQPAPEPPQNVILRFKKAHLKLGILLTIVGGIQMILDPLLPALFMYPYSLFPGGLFMLISGICSIHGSRREDRCSLRASLTFDILALVLVFIAIIIAIVVIIAGDSILFCKSSIYLCYPSVDFYSSGLKGFSIFNLIYGIILFVLLCWDSGIKCGDVCCCKRRQPRVTYNPNGPN